MNTETESSNTTDVSGIARLCTIMKRLRAPGGCPWDREQTFETLKPCLLEETYELLDAMSRKDDIDNHIEELGDVLLQVVFQCAIREESGDFDFNTVANAIADKLIRRHPHVFGTVDAKDSATVLKNWEQIKQNEKHGTRVKNSALDGVPPVLPALLKAQRTQEKASRVGFDWDDASGAISKIKEELAELDAAVAAHDIDNIREELGDTLFSIVNYARFLKVDAEAALESTTAKFSRRFRAVEQIVKESGRTLKDCTLAEMDNIWDNVKHNEQ